MDTNSDDCSYESYPQDQLKKLRVNRDLYEQEIKNVVNSRNIDGAKKLRGDIVRDRGAAVAIIEYITFSQDPSLSPRARKEYEGLKMEAESIRRVLNKFDDQIKVMLGWENAQPTAYLSELESTDIWGHCWEHGLEG